MREKEQTQRKLVHNQDEDLEEIKVQEHENSEEALEQPKYQSNDILQRL